MSGDKRRNANTEVDEHAGLEFASDALSDDRLRIH